ncbi:MAG: hypothetical protein K2M43_03315 [Mycoplasmoidaceae bacterium]|nr:hypothetical protein [Mycoplasmoidaceae bacterium]
MSATNPICSKCQDLEPVSNTVKEAYKNYFDQLVKELKIDVALNKELSEEYYSNLNNIDKANKSIRTKNI